MLTNPWVLRNFLFVFLLSSSAFGSDVKEWNFLIFINGVNNLDDYGAININQMEEVGSNENMNIIVQWGSLARPSVDRLVIRKDNNTNRVTSPVVQRLGKADMGDWRNLVSFARWAQDNYPARRTFLVIWNHGTGWHIKRGFQPRDISSDERTGNSITTEQLGQAMREISSALGKKIDIYASDACLMGMVEVADEMSDSVDYFIGSQDLEPGDGWPYNTFLKAWKPEMSPKEISQLLTKEYLAAYQDGMYGSRKVTLSAYDLSKIHLYRDAVRAVGAELSQLSASDLQSIKKEADVTKNFIFGYLDMKDFMNRISKLNFAVSSAAVFQQAHDEFVIANEQNQDDQTHGVSIWIPIEKSEYSNYKKRYEKLVFNQHTQWLDFVRKLYP